MVSIGPNGSGKTTLLKLIQGQLNPDAGFIARDKNCHIAYMAQDVDLDPQRMVFDVVRDGAARVLSLKAELDEIEKRFVDPHYYTYEKRLARLVDR